MVSSEMQPLTQETPRTVDTPRTPEPARMGALKGGAAISEEDYHTLAEFVWQMKSCIRLSELVFFIGVPMIGTTGATFTTKEKGFPWIFYLGYVPLLLVSKGIELYYLKRWRELDPRVAEIQKDQWAHCLSFSNPLVHIFFGILEHSDLFLDVIFTSMAFACGYKMLAMVSGATLLLSVLVQLGCSSSTPKAMVASERDVYGPVMEVWMACNLQGMSWLGEVCKIVRFGGLDKPDMGLTSRQHFATILCEQCPQMVLQALFFRWNLEEMEEEARVKQWLSVAVSICVMLNKARQEHCLFLILCIVISVVTAVIMVPWEIVDSKVVWA